MESLEESSAAKHQRSTRRDMQQTMQTGGPSSAKIELAGGTDAKKEKRAEQEVKFESQDKEKMKMDNLWLQVKGEIKEEIEQEEQQEQTCKSSSLDDLTRKEIMMKEEMEEDPKHDEAFESLQSQSDHSEVATQKREIEKSNMAANSQAAAEPEPKLVAKRRRLTRRDMQQPMQTGGPSSVKIEFADGVKVKKEKNAEQEIGFKRQDKEKMELDDLWLKVHKKVKLPFAAANSAAGHVPKPPKSELGTGQVQTSTQQQLEPSAFGMEDASRSKADEDCFGVYEMRLDCSGRISIQNRIRTFGAVIVSLTVTQA